MAWELQGNSGTNPGTDYLGTADPSDLSIRTKGIERIGVLHSAGPSDADVVLHGALAIGQDGSQGLRKDIVLSVSQLSNEDDPNALISLYAGGPSADSHWLMGTGSQAHFGHTGYFGIRSADGGTPFRISPTGHVAIGSPPSATWSKFSRLTVESHGSEQGQRAIRAFSQTGSAIFAQSSAANEGAIWAESEHGSGVSAVTRMGRSPAVEGWNYDVGPGVTGRSTRGPALLGASLQIGESDTPSNNFHLVTNPSAPAMRLYNGNYGSGQHVLTVMRQDPHQALIGIGTENPQRSLDIAATSGSTEVLIRDNSQPADQRVWRLVNNSQLLSIEAVNDALTGGTNVINFSRNGNATIGKDIRLENADGATIYARGRLHMHGEELLYLLNKGGVVIGKEWGGNGSLRAQGDATVGAGGDGTLRTRHIAGKHWQNDSDSGLHLNYWSGQTVYVGNPNAGGTPASLVVSGNVGIGTYQTSTRLQVEGGGTTAIEGRTGAGATAIVGLNRGSGGGAGVVGQGDSVVAGVGGMSSRALGVVGVNGGGSLPPLGNSGNRIGVFGVSNDANGLGVGGFSRGAFAGVEGYNPTGANAGVYGHTDSSNGPGVYGMNTAGGLAGDFRGNVRVVGTMSASTKLFKIDHPLEPANKYLSHTSVESPDMMTVYNGNATTNSDGEATVELPNYFEALNRDFRYQLTVLGQAAQAFVQSEIVRNRFVIKTDRPSVKVSWQITGIRQDAYAEAHRTPIEEEKPPDERGRYLHPELYAEEAVSARAREPVGYLRSAVGGTEAVHVPEGEEPYGQLLVDSFGLDPDDHAQ